MLALGHQPADEDVADWMDLATSVLTYRVIYEFINPAVALGPGGHDDPHREACAESSMRPAGPGPAEDCRIILPK